MSVVLAIDAGTTGVRTRAVFDDGQESFSSYKEFTQYFPQPGWVEHDAIEIWNAIVATLQDVCGQLTQPVSAIGITNQRETVVAWDKRTGQPSANAIVWQDVRTASYLDSLPESARATLTHKSGLTVAPYFAGSKMHWLVENSAEVKSAIKAGTARFGTVDSWLLWNLSGGVQGGVHFTDVTNASRTLLMNLETLQWDEELLGYFGIPRNLLPEIKSSSEIYATTNPHGPLGSAVPIAGILGDQHAAMVGQACFEKGSSKTTYGTGNFALLNTGTEIVRSKHGLLTTVCFKFGDQPAQYALEGSVAVTGSAIQWLRDQLGIISSAAEVETLALQVKDSGGVYFVPAFSGLFAPYWRSDARGVIVGLTRATTKAHLARAALDAICYQTMEIMEAMVADSGIAMTEMKVDGGITANQLCMQLQADVMGIDIVKPLITETTALGAAYAAGLAIGFWKSTDEVKAQWRQDRRWQAESDEKTRTIGAAQWKRAVERTFNWVE